MTFGLWAIVPCVSCVPFVPLLSPVPFAHPSPLSDLRGGAPALPSLRSLSPSPSVFSLTAGGFLLYCGHAVFFSG